MWLLSSGIAHAQTVQVGTVTGTPGQQVLVPLNFTNLNNVGAITLYITYDASVVTFVDITNIIPQAAGILANGMTNPTRVGLSWIATSGGVNFPNGKCLDIRFTYLGGSVPFNFTTACEIVDWDGYPIAVTYVNGAISPDSGPATATWAGSVSQAWSDAANWIGNQVPGTATSVTIPQASNHPVIDATDYGVVISGLTLEPLGALTVLGNLLVTGNLNMKSDASLIENGNLTVNGATSIERFVTGGGNIFHFVSQPVANASAGIFLGQYLRYYEEPTQNWVNIVDPLTPLEVAKGYSLNAVANNTFVFGDGNFNHGDFPVGGLTFTIGSNPDYRGWHLVGNPFASSLVWDPAGSLGYPGWNPAGLDHAAFVWDAAIGNYRFGNAFGTGSLTGNIIPPMQGLFVHVTDPSTAPGSLSFPQAARVHGGLPFYKSSDNVMQIQVDGNGFSDISVIQLFDGATAGFDSQYDALKMAGLADAPQLYSMIDGQVNLAGNMLPMTSYVNLGLQVGADNTYTLTVSGIESFDDQLPLFLEDLKEGIIQDLRNNPVYTFTASVNDDESRFRIYFTNPVSVSELVHDGMLVYASGSIIHISIDRVMQGSINIYNMTGQEVFGQSVKGAGVFSYKVIESGSYIVKIHDNSRVITTKVFIN